MIEAITYQSMKNQLNKKYNGQNKTFAIMLVRPSKSDVAQEILSNISYFHHRSRNKLDIFLPGYGADWGDAIPDSKNVCKVENVDWSYSSKHFVDFIDEIESVSKLKYQGGSELILLDFVCSDISYKSVVRIKLDRAIRDGSIESVEEFIDKVISKFIKSTTAYKMSDILTLTELGKSIADELKRKFFFLRTFVRSKHYTICNYEKAES